MKRRAARTDILVLSFVWKIIFLSESSAFIIQPSGSKGWFVHEDFFPLCSAESFIFIVHSTETLFSAESLFLMLDSTGTLGFSKFSFFPPGTVVSVFEPSGSPTVPFSKSTFSSLTVPIILAFRFSLSHANV